MNVLELRCVKCRYDLRGYLPEQCPECGLVYVNNLKEQKRLVAFKKYKLYASATALILLGSCFIPSIASTSIFTMHVNSWSKYDMLAKLDIVMPYTGFFISVLTLLLLRFVHLVNGILLLCAINFIFLMLILLARLMWMDSGL